MTEKEKDQYIESLELQVSELLEQKLDIPVLLKAQQEFLTQKYAEKDYLLSENKRLNEEIGRLTRTILLNYNYIDYLLNSFWWKASFPFRLVSRKIKSIRRKKLPTSYFIHNIHIDNEPEPLDTSVSVLIFAYNAGKEFSLQLSNLKKQKLVKDIEIIVFDRGSTDGTVNLAKKEGATVIDIKNLNLTDEEVYEKSLSKIHGKYVVLMDQNKVVNSQYWIYQAVKPLLEERATVVSFFRDQAKYDADVIRSAAYYPELKDRICAIADERVIFLPENRDIIQYICPIILDKSAILVKKKISNFMYI